MLQEPAYRIDVEVCCRSDAEIVGPATHLPTLPAASTARIRRRIVLPEEMPIVVEGEASVVDELVKGWPLMLRWIS